MYCALASFYPCVHGSQFQLPPVNYGLKIQSKANCYVLACVRGRVMKSVLEVDSSLAEACAEYV